MKKNAAILLCTGAAAVGLLAGCGEISRFIPGEGGPAAGSAENVTTDQAVGTGPFGWLPEDMPQILSETEPDRMIRDAVAEYFEIPREEWEDVRYYYNFTDLDDDGTDEIFALAVGSYVSGSGGSSALILKNDGTVVQSLTTVNAPVVVSDEMTNGYHNLVVERCGGGADTEAVVLRASEDGVYENVPDSQETADLSTLTGVALFCDDMTFDDTADYLTLAD